MRPLTVKKSALLACVSSLIAFARIGVRARPMWLGCDDVHMPEIIEVEVSGCLMLFFA
jgi:hypothetical protein